MPPVVLNLREAEDQRDVVHRVVQTLAEGGVAALPTETVYGLAAGALNEAAVCRLLNMKRRTVSKPMALAIKSPEEAHDYVPDICPLARRLARRCWPGPVTLVLDDSHPDSLVHRLPPKVRELVSPQARVGLRVPGYPLVLEVLRLLPCPLVLTSANYSTQAEPVSGRDVLAALGAEVDLVVDDGPCRFGQPSSVVAVGPDGLRVLREGVVPEQTLRRLASLMILFVCTGNTCRSPMAEALCRNLFARRWNCPAEELEDRGVVVLSAGISAMLGGRASAEAVQCMAEQGLDINLHETQPLTEPLVRRADLIYTMTRLHRETIVAQWPSAAERTRLLDVRGMDILDPIGGPVERYRQCAQHITSALEHRLEEIELEYHSACEPVGKRSGRNRQK